MFGFLRDFPLLGKNDRLRDLTCHKAARHKIIVFHQRFPSGLHSESQLRSQVLSSCRPSRGRRDERPWGRSRVKAEQNITDSPKTEIASVRIDQDGINFIATLINDLNQAYDSFRATIFIKVHLTPKYFFRLNKSLHLFETHCFFLN